MMKTLFLRTIFTLACLALSSATLASEINANGQKGKVLHDKLCVSCHAGMFGTDGSGIYTRSDHKVDSYQSLEGQIGNCNHNLGLHLSKEQLANILDYLNQAYYKFEKQ